MPGAGDNTTELLREADRLATALHRVFKELVECIIVFRTSKMEVNKSRNGALSFVLLQTHVKNVWAALRSSLDSIVLARRGIIRVTQFTQRDDVCC